MNVAQVIETGLGISFQDKGREGWRRFGIPTGGIMDGTSAQLANELVGNLPHETLLECTLHGAEIRFIKDSWVALAGACSSPSLASGTARLMRSGETLKISPTPQGIWSYLAIPGGWKSGFWFGSSSTDIRSRMGESITSGTILKSNGSNLVPYHASIASRSASDATVAVGFPPIEGFPILPGPQFENFSQLACEQLVQQTWRISLNSDRTGFRLEGSAMDLAPDITSEAVLPGSIQVPGSGLPIVTMPDGPTVGGYPKVAYIEPEYLWQLAQCQPGTQIKFKWSK
ncbi:MAG: biotin-dependent carboxyltransferase family protein [Verrucomicrobiota bacterium]